MAARPNAASDAVAVRLLRGAKPGETLVLEQVPLVDGNPSRIELERFEVWTPNAQIIVYDESGKTHTVERPKTLFYKGRVDGDPDSAVAISVEPNGKISGAIFARDKMFSMSRGVRVAEGVKRGGLNDDSLLPVERDAPVFVREFDPVEDLIDNPQARGWHCDADQVTLEGVRDSLRGGKRVANAVVSNGTIVTNGTPSGFSGNVGYGLTVAVETDGELWAAFGTDAAATAYIGNLFAQASVIYQRDLKTTLTVGTVHLRQSAATDPWTVTAASSTSAALAEFGTYWHNNYPGVARSSAVFLSGKPFYGGVAWSDFLCQGDFYCGDTGANCGGAPYGHSYAGGYAFCGSTSVTTTVPDPTLTVHGFQYGVPNSANFWMLLEMTHELGHNANGPHTHCVPLSAAEQSLYGVTRAYVDNCYSGECYTGTTSVPSEHGTIMSYCHNVNDGTGYPPTRYLFGKAGEASSAIYGDDAAKCFAAGGAPCYFAAGFSNATIGLNATITFGAPGSNLSCAVGQTASVPANGAATFSWQISGGVITAGASTNAITFTPTASTTTVSVTTSNAQGCSLKNSASVTTQCTGLSAPANVVATAASATSVTVTWSAAVGATKYHVYRSANNSTYTQVNGETTTGTSFTDSSAAGGTAYLYKVRAVDGANVESSDSNKDLATTVIFTDATLTAQSTTIKSAHFTEVRTAVNAVRALAGLGAAAFTDATITAHTTLIKRIHVIDLRTALDAARATLSLSTLTYTDGTVTLQSTPVKAIHLTELRNGVK